MAAMTEAAREAFLSRPRIGVLSMLAEDGAPVAIRAWLRAIGTSMTRNGPLPCNSGAIKPARCGCSKSSPRGFAPIRVEGCARQ
jgi:hypothetical protein